jgi:hypothetical protein
VKRYFKHEAESELGVGMAYLEITDDWPSRQIEVYGEMWRWGDDAHPERLADQPFAVLDLDERHEISAEEFERTWSEALKRWPPAS